MTRKSYLHHVFLSYSRKDTDIMGRVRDALCAEGLAVWTDETGLEPSTPIWEMTVEQAIKDAGCMVVLLSPDAAKSRWVTRETAFAEEWELRIFPVLIRGDSREAVPIRLTSHQRIDALCDLDSAIRRLSELVRKHLGIAGPSTQGECEETERRRREEQEAAEHNYAIIRVMAERDDPARVWGALLGFWETYPGYDPDGLSGRFMPDLPALDFLPPPFEWCKIPATADFRLVTDDGDLGTFTINPFYMAKYPVTYAQFQVFVDAEDGFGNPSWWEGLAAGIDHKQQPGDQFLKVDNHPRENVSWYDAIAFCRWLTAKYSQGLLPFSLREKGLGDEGLGSGDEGQGAGEGWEVRLPTEWEWQWAAQGADGRDYPWGPSFDTARCNTEESGIKQTTPVNQYLSGSSPFGVMDMAGNVWEWCLNGYDNPENTNLAESTVRVLRGGSWSFNQYLGRCVFRYWDSPKLRLNLCGFRVVCARPLST